VARRRRKLVQAHLRLSTMSPLHFCLNVADVVRVQAHQLVAALKPPDSRGPRLEARTKPTDVRGAAAAAGRPQTRRARPFSFQRAPPSQATSSKAADVPSELQGVRRQ